MVSELLAGDLPGDLNGLVVRQAEGNPFFVEELLESLIDQGVLQPANGGWTATELPANFAVPDSVQAVLAARIDLLPPAEKAALQAASVIGRAFWTSPIYELVPELLPNFRVLEGRDFIRRRAGSAISGETEYVFKHQLTREVAYAGLPKGSLARRFRRLAGALRRRTRRACGHARTALCRGAESRGCRPRLGRCPGRTRTASNEGNHVAAASQRARRRPV